MAALVDHSAPDYPTGLRRVLNELRGEQRAGLAAERELVAVADPQRELLVSHDRPITRR